MTEHEQQGEPDTTELDDKPVEEQLPDEGDVSAEELDEIQKAGEEEVEREGFIAEEEAREDETIDDQEIGEGPWPPGELPEGTTAADYDRVKEHQDSEEETPPR